MIHINNLKVKYSNSNKLAIENISLDLAKGEKLVLLGPSGCGKTTLLNLLSGLFGKKEVEVQGEVSFSRPGLKIRSVFQRPTLLPWRDVENNIAYGLEIEKVAQAVIKPEVSRVLEMVGLEECRNAYPKQLSIGMQQRVNFARALVSNPDVLLLDEPFSALDLETKKKIQVEFLAVLKQRQTSVIFVTHDMEEASFFADRIVVLSKGPAIVKHVFENKSSFSTNNFQITDYFDPYE